MSKYDVIIIGSGPAGLTAAIYASRGGLKTLVLTGNQPGGQPMMTDIVENFPGFPNGIKGPELMQRVQKQAERFGAELVIDAATGIKQNNTLEVKSADTSKVLFQVKTRKDKLYSAKSIIIASGATPRWLSVPGVGRFKGKGVSVCATCDGPFFKDKIVAVVGGGDTALTEAEFLTKFAQKVYLIHRRENLRAQRVLQSRVRDNPKVTVLFNSEVKKFLGEKSLRAVEVQTQYQVNSDQREEETKAYADQYGEVIDKNGERAIWKLAVNGVFLAIGYIPNTDFLKGFVDLDDHGYVMTDRDVLTSVEGVFAAGDCVDYRYRQNVVACGMGCKAALEVEKFLKRNF